MEVLEVVGDKSQKVVWPGCGLFLEVPDKTLPPGVTASVAIKAILAGQLQFPEDRKLISAEGGNGGEHSPLCCYQVRG